MYYTYILWSELLQKFYVGSTQDLESRVDYHNSGNVNFTSTGIPWVLVYHESHATRSLASKRERQIKAWKSAKAIRRLIEGQAV